MNTSKKFSVLERAVSILTSAVVAVLPFALFNISPSAQAGWSVNVGYSGSGTITLKVSHAGVTNIVKTPFVAFPSAAINPQIASSVFTNTGSLPAGASSSTYVQVWATNQYRTTIQSVNGPGDGNDGDETLPFVIPTSACASSSVTVEPTQITANSITFHYSAKLSDEGSAALLRVIDALTGQQRFVVLLTGPSDNTGNTCEGNFTVIGDPTQLNLVLDGSTSTLPINLTCPPDVVFGCGVPVPETYNPPAVATGPTGPFTLTYSPLPSQLVPGVTNVVTVTATDTNGCTKTCQFNAYREVIAFDGFRSPIGGADATGGSCSEPLRTFKLGNTVPVKFSMTCGGVPITGGTPPLIKIESCTGVSIPFVGLFVLFNNEWHFNIDSTIIGTGANYAGKYKITALLPDGNEHSAFIQYKK
jgi:hypothetical protein